MNAMYLTVYSIRAKDLETKEKTRDFKVCNRIWIFSKNFFAFT